MQRGDDADLAPGDKNLNNHFSPLSFLLLSFFRFFFHPPPLTYIPRMAAPVGCTNVFSASHVFAAAEKVVAAAFCLYLHSPVQISVFPPPPTGTYTCRVVYPPTLYREDCLLGGGFFFTRSSPRNSNIFLAAMNTGTHSLRLGGFDARRRKGALHDSH